jgi:hypothetical protein
MSEVVIVRSAMRDLDRLNASLEEIDLVTSHLEAVLRGQSQYGKVLFQGGREMLFTDCGRFRILFIWPDDLKAIEFRLRS